MPEVTNSTILILNLWQESMTAQNKEEFAGRLDDNSYELETLACHVGQNPQQHHSRDIVAPISLSTTFALDEPQDHSVG